MREAINVWRKVMELKSFYLFPHIFIYFYWTEKLSADYVGGQQLDKICHILLSSSLLLSLTHSPTHTHTQRHTHIRAGKVHPPCMYWPDKSETPDEGHTDKHANLASICPLFHHSSSYLQLFVPFRQTLSALHFLHHSAHFCLAHPLANSVTSPYVSHLSPPALLPSCQMPVIHIWSVCTSCCSSLSSHPHTLTSSSLFLPLIQLCSSPSLPRSFALSNSSSPTVFPPSSCALDKCLCHMHFHHCKTSGIGAGCNTHSYYPVTLPLSLCVDSYRRFFYSSFPRSITSSILVK